MGSHSWRRGDDVIDMQTDFEVDRGEKMLYTPPSRFELYSIKMQDVYLNCDTTSALTVSWSTKADPATVVRYCVKLKKERNWKSSQTQHWFISLAGWEKGKGCLGKIISKSGKLFPLLFTAQ